MQNPYLDEEEVTAKRHLEEIRAETSPRFVHLIRSSSAEYSLKGIKVSREAFQSLDPTLQLALNLHKLICKEGGVHDMLLKLALDYQLQPPNYSHLVGRTTEYILGNNALCHHVAEFFIKEFGEDMAEKIFICMHEATKKAAP